MDFIPQREFYHPEVQSKMKRKRTSENVNPTMHNVFYIGVHIELRVRS